MIKVRQAILALMRVHCLVDASWVLKPGSSVFIYYSQVHSHYSRIDYALVPRDLIYDMESYVGPKLISDRNIYSSFMNFIIT